MYLLKTEVLKPGQKGTSYIYLIIQFNTCSDLKYWLEKQKKFPDYLGGGRM